MTTRAHRAESMPGPRVGAESPSLRTFTVGTAGHVDHGKSALVRALTGIDPDRLKEERDRGMTIVLGFAPLMLPSGRRCDLVDVPGHESLIRTMVSGACGLDAVVLCVDARKGPMPQTREHVQILGLLGITRGLVAVTKADLLESVAEQDAVRAALERWLGATALAGAPICLTSARTAQGIPELCVALEALLETATPRDSRGPVRLPVDRSFTIRGAGCVVTGTLWSGTLKPGLELALLPGDTNVRVRGLELHGESVGSAAAGERPAVNLAGVDAKSIARGAQLVDPRAFTSTTRFTARITFLPGGTTLARNCTVDFLAGTASGRARLRFLDSATPQAAVDRADERLAIVRLDSPMTLAFGDVAVLRTTGGERTLGAAHVLDIAPPADMGRTVHLSRSLAAATPREAVRAVVRSGGLAGNGARDLQHRFGVAADGLAVLVRSRRRYWHEDALDQAKRALIEALPAPGRSVWLRDWWRASPIQEPAVLEAMTRDIVHVYHAQVDGGLLSLPPSPTAAIGRIARRRLERALYVDVARIVPVDALAESAELRRGDTARTLRALIADGLAVRVSRRHVCHRSVLARLCRQLSRLGSVTDHEVMEQLALTPEATRDLLGYLGSLGMRYRTGRRSAPEPIRIRRSHDGVAADAGR